jgi:hypothetical protein
MFQKVRLVIAVDDMYCIRLQHMVYKYSEGGAIHLEIYGAAVNTLGIPSRGTMIQLSFWRRTWKSSDYRAD